MVRIEHGFAFKGEFFADSGRQIVLTPGNFYEEGGFRSRPGKDRYYSGEFPERYVLERHALIVAMTEQGEGLLGSAALVPDAKTYLHNQRIGRVKERRELADRRFLYYLFNTDHVRQQIRNSSSGTKVRHTSPERMYSAEVKVPDLELQRKIAAILSAYDDLIANNQRRIALLESMAEEIYREWFVRMRFPGHESAHVVGFAHGSWSRSAVGDLCQVIKRGITPKYADDADRLVINQKCIRDGRVSLGDARAHDTVVPDEKLLRYGDVLINSTGVGTLGRVAVFDLAVLGA
ncbi:MAG: restriction endonuclease subunit S, partial [Ramlibacter sp.]|nr:restriction endonuclease subunit S [Ramlibacter sp.]